MPSVRGQYAQSILAAHHESIEHSIPPLVKPIRSSGEVVKIGIIGAGAAGLYLALMIDYLKGQKGSEFNYDYVLHEANPSETHVGGRIYTYRFPPLNPNDKVPGYDYYDVGAMRFPKLPWMKPTFDLFPYLGITSIKYIMDDKLKNNVSFFNGITQTAGELENYYKSQTDNDPFKTGVIGLTGDPDKMAKDKINPFMSGLISNWSTGWANMMGSDRWSTRGYMGLDSAAAGPPYSDDVVSYLETFNSATGMVYVRVPPHLLITSLKGLYDCALTESVMDALDFDFEPPKPTDDPDWHLWHCINGGTDLIIHQALNKISTQPKRGDRATAITPVWASGENTTGQKPTAMTITIVNNGATKQHQYDHVVSTVPLSCLGQLDTSECDLSWNLRTAIRDLHYDCSTKVAIRFSSRWWETLQAPQIGPQIGGVSSTDRPTRTVVYPSYGIKLSEGATMIVSYTWAQDAFRLGSLAKGKGSDAEQALIAGILKDLTDMHGITDPTYLQGLMLDYHVYNWYAHEFSMGAFALFGPGQFENLYPWVTKPVYGRLHFAGEATSVHHAWVVGALNSAYRSLVEINNNPQLEHEGQGDLVQYLHAEGSPFRNAGTDEVSQKLVNLQVRLGQSLRHK
ncbi:hypothetical protein FRC10_009450 [Ceratobasidium sp. 414]|nr:hypothetical protein FRC10_009450 [Ceratobasidium sp. 414]